jgi:hypothetical protein
MVTAGQAYISKHLENGPLALQFANTISKAIANTAL